MTVVLVVSEVDTSAVIRRFCEAQAFSILHAPDALTAIAMAERHGPDAIVTPRHPADSDGLVVIAELRDVAPDALVIVVGDGDDLTVLDAGADIVVGSPFDEPALVSALSTMLAPAARLVLTIVEPDAHLASVVERWLGGAFDVTVVQTGWRAIEVTRLRRPDAVLAELRLPDMDPAELHAAIDKACPGLGERMLFMTTGFIADKAQQFLTRLPGQAIYKPFDLARLRSALAALID